jgi:Asp/Glu/hydantoin racemase
VFPDSPAARDISASAYLEAGVNAEQQGYAGVYINTVGDYGLAELRGTLQVPVTGSGEGVISAAQARGRFAIVTIWPPAMRFIYDHVLAETGAADDCVAIHHLSDNADLATLDQPDNFVHDMQACSLTSMSKIRAACRDSMDQGGAEVIVLGCTCMQPVAALLEAEGIPALEPMVSGYRYLESLLDERAGESPSRDG